MSLINIFFFYGPHLRAKEKNVNSTKIFSYTTIYHHSNRDAADITEDSMTAHGTKKYNSEDHGQQNIAEEGHKLDDKML